MTINARSRALFRLPAAATLFLAAPLFVLPLIAGWAAAPQTGVAKKTIQFNRDIRPLLSDNCFYCHGPDKNHRQADLRLDVREAVLARQIIVPGKPKDSKLFARVMTSDADEQMPPPSAHKVLTPKQKQTLQTWIQEGAEYEPHWAYIVPKRPVVPKVSLPGFPVRNAVDAFVQAKLAEKHLTPSPEADKRTLLRRVTLDVTGLPPTPAEVTAFLTDKSPNAYEKVVDRLLQSPHYGERMATPWLDLVRYADTVGFHGDQNQNAWPYRDYVIDSFNQNKPFDTFTVEQIAGDLLPHATPEQKTATAFSRLTMMTREGGAQDKEYLAKYAADRVRTVSIAWLGSTMGCAECHDHKFDPFSQRDFYSLAAFFGDVQQWGVYADYGYTSPEIKGYNNDSPFPPEITVQSRYLLDRMAQKQARLTRLAEETAPTCKPGGRESAHFEAWRKAGALFWAVHPDGWETFAAPVVSSVAAPPAPAAPMKAPAKPAATAAVTPAPNPSPSPTPPPAPAFAVLPGGEVRFADAAPGNVQITVAPTGPALAALRVQVLPDTVPNGGSGTIFRTGAKSALLTLSAAITRQAAPDKPESITFRYASADYFEPRYNSGFALLGVGKGWKLSGAYAGRSQTSVWLPETPLILSPGDKITVTLPNAGMACVKVSASPFVPASPDAQTISPALRAALQNERAAAIAPLVLRAYLMGTGWDAPRLAAAKALEADIAACRDGKTPVLTTVSVKPAVTRVLPRGNWQDESGPIVQPAVPHFLTIANTATDAQKPLTRLDLARWIVSPQNPLTARVYVNRLWKQFFGNGLSGQVEDLGAQGEWPSHPELLDYLAVEFERDWNIKRMVRLLVTSATYRQSSSLRPELRTLDPNNRLLASQNPRRLEAEFVRDNALSVSGLLNEDRGGPPVKPYQPANYYAAIQFPDRPYQAETDERQYRRAVYSHWQRTFLHPALLNFDAPSREDCTAFRTVANTPQQALTLLNDPEFVEAARVLAARTLSAPVPAKNKETDAARLEWAYQTVLARSPKPTEKQSLLRFLNAMRTAYKAHPGDAEKMLAIGNAPAPKGDMNENAAWTSLCRVLLNLNETITRY